MPITKIYHEKMRQVSAIVELALWRCNNAGALFRLWDQSGLLANDCSVRHEIRIDAMMQPVKR